MHLIFKLGSALSLTLAFAATSIAQEKVLLKQQVQAGKTYSIEQEMTMDKPVSLKVNTGMDLAVSQPKPEEKAVSVKFSGFKMTMDMMGNTIEMDSSDPEQKETFGAILEMNPVLIYDNEDNFIRAEGLDAAAAPGSPAASLGDPESLKQLVGGMMMGDMPEEGIVLGHKWKSKVDLPIPNMGNMEMVINNHFEKFEVIDGHKCAVIKFSGKLEGAVEQEGVGTMTFKEGSTFSGSFHFDPAIGYNRKQELLMNLLMGMQEAEDIPMNIKQIVTLTKVSDNE